MHDDVRAVNGVYEMFQGDRQLTIGGDEIVFTESDAEALRNALYEETSFGEKYVFNGANFAILTRVCAKLNRHNPLPAAITRTRLFEAYSVVDAAGGMTEFGTLERVPEEVVAPAAPIARDDQGRFINPLLAEYHQMISDPTVHSSQITKRMQTDRAFREAVESEGRAKPAQRDELEQGQHALDLAHYGEFARAFRLEPNPKYMHGRITVGGVAYTKDEFEKHMTEAARLGL